MTDTVQESFEKLRTQFAVLVAAGYAGGPLAGEQGTYRISVPFSGRVYEGITVVSNLPSLPYGASPTRLVQAAVFNWLYVLTGKLADQAPEIAMLHQHYRWEMRMRQASEESRQLRAFREYLAEKASELSEGGDTLGILRELREVAGEAPTPSLYLKCNQATADNPIVRKAIGALVGPMASELSEWLEPWVYG